MEQQMCCRTCLAECGDLVPIFSNDCYVDNLPDKLLNTIRIEIQEDDRLPKMICKKCIFLVDSLHCFKDQCEMAEMKLKQSLKDDLPSFSNVGQLLSACEADDTSVFKTEYSSDDDSIYQIEYISEEARIEIENSRKQKQNAKRENKKNSGVKVKSVEILPVEPKANLYKNLASTPSKHTNVKEESNTSDVEDRSSTSSSDGLSKYSNNMYDTYEKFNNDSVLMDEENIYHDEPLVKRITKRKVDDNNIYSHLSKAQKKVMFKEETVIDDDVHYMEIIKNQSENSQNTIKDNSTEKLSQSYMTRNSSKNIMNCLKSVPSDNDVKQTLDMRMNIIMKLTAINFPEICTICMSSFESFNEVLKHKLECHLSDQPSYFCPICFENFPSNRCLVDHVDIHEEIHSLICIFCLTCFYTEESFKRHLHETHINLQESYCYMCSKKYNGFQQVLNHLTDHMSDTNLTCMLCSFVSTSKRDLQNHLNKHHGQHLTLKNSKCETCGMRLTKKELVEHVIKHPSHLCPYCKKGFIQKESLRDHINIHISLKEEENNPEQNKFDCYLCFNSFASLDDRTQHMQEQHMTIKEQQVQSTEKQLPSNSVKPTALDRKKFRCRVCREIIVSQNTYINHLKTEHLNAKQTNEILKELSESSINERRNELQTKNDLFSFT